MLNIGGQLQTGNLRDGGFNRLDWEVSSKQELAGGCKGAQRCHGHRIGCVRTFVGEPLQLGVYSIGRFFTLAFRGLPDDGTGGPRVLVDAPGTRSLMRPASAGTAAPE